MWLHLWSWQIPFLEDDFVALVASAVLAVPIGPVARQEARELSVAACRYRTSCALGHSV